MTSSNNECVMCLSTLCVDDRVMPEQVPCGHTDIHWWCLGRWQQVHDTCPMCRSVLVKPPTDIETMDLCNAVYMYRVSGYKYPTASVFRNTVLTCFTQPSPAREREFNKAMTVASEWQNDRAYRAIRGLMDGRGFHTTAEQFSHSIMTGTAVMLCDLIGNYMGPLDFYDSHGWTLLHLASMAGVDSHTKLEIIAKAMLSRDTHSDLNPATKLELYLPRQVLSDAFLTRNEFMALAKKCVIWTPRSITEALGKEIIF